VAEELPEGRGIAGRAAPGVDIGANRVLESDPASLEQQHQRRCRGDRLGERSQVEYSIHGHAAGARDECRLADRVFIHDFSW
jgi:hypothetical protein